MSNAENISSIAFFDFDGTITNKDSMWLFLKYFCGNLKFYTQIIPLIPALLLFKLGIITSKNIKEIVFKKFFKNYELVLFQEKCKLFTDKILVNHFRFEAMQRIIWHEEKGHQIVVVSASPMNWIKYWCLSKNIDLIATELEVCNQKLTGQIKGENCKGEQKVIRIKQNYDLAAYETVYAYGDSVGDKEMLEIADKAFYRRFD
jgi:HAD superfamily hydrolase (TIGR01490 family)